MNISRTKIPKTNYRREYYRDEVIELDEIDQDCFTFEVPISDGGNIREMAKWLRENIGMQATLWDYKVNIKPDEKDFDIFIFLHEEDAIAFKLMWV